MSIKLTNQSTKDADKAVEKSKERSVFQNLAAGVNNTDAASGAEEVQVGNVVTNWFTCY